MRRSLFLPLFLLALTTGCSRFERDNPIDPTSTNYYRPHFRKSAEIPNQTNVQALWAGASNFLVRGHYSGNGFWMGRYDYQGQLLKEANLNLPSSMGTELAKRFTAAEAPGTNRLFIATNSRVVCYDFDFNEVSNLQPFADLNTIKDLVAFPGAAGIELIVSRAVSPWWVFPGVWNRINPLPPIADQDGPWLALARGGSGAVSQLVSVSREYVVASNNSSHRIHIIRADISNCHYEQYHDTLSLSSTLQGIPYSGFNLPVAYSNYIYFLTVTRGKRSMLRHHAETGLEWVLLDPEPTFTPLAFHISVDGRLVLYGADRILCYTPTGL